MASDYYWVGNGGDWSDLSHWATTSGGSEFHDNLPGPEDRVFFDEQSFTSVGETVNLDINPIEIKSLDGSSVTNSPTLLGLNFGDVLQVSEDFLLPASFQRDLKVLQMSPQDGGDYNLDMGGVNMGGSSFVRIDGDGSIYLQDEIEAAYLYVVNGNFYSSDFDMTFRVNLDVFENGDGFVDLGQSHLLTRILELGDEADLDASEATIELENPGFLDNQGIFEGLSLHFHHVICNDYIRIYDSNSFDVFEIQPGAVVELQAGSTQTADEFLFTGTGAQNITLRSDEEGTQATISQSVGSVEGEYLILRDNLATGGATFTANLSIDQGNNEGWNIIENQPADYFWVGGPGLWSDLSHWATESGGAELHTELPTVQDRVFIDENSFTGIGEQVTINIDPTIKDLIIGDLPDNCGLSVLDNAIQLFLYGALEISEGATVNLAVVHLLSDEAQEISTNGVYTGAASRFLIEGDGAYSLLSNFYVDQIQVSSGGLISNGNDIVLSESFETMGMNPFLLDLSNSFVQCSNWRPMGVMGNYLLNGSVLNVSGQFRAYDLDYAIVNLSGTAPMVFSGDAEIETLNIAPGANITFEAGSEIVTGELNIESEELNPVSLQSDTPGLHWTFNQSSGIVEAYFMAIQDNHAEGGAAFNAYFCNLGSNVVGWNDVTHVDTATRIAQKIYPNPGNGSFNLEGLELGAEYSVLIMDQSGRRVKAEQFIGKSQNHFDYNELETGCYLLSIQKDHARVFSGRLVIR